jgi:probable selenium-dependent hydroxylase accessory protein YqeC
MTKKMTSLKEGFALSSHGVVSFVGAGGKTSLMFALAKELVSAGQSVITTTTTRVLMPSKEQCAHVILTRSMAELLERAREIGAETPHFLTAQGEDKKGKLIGFPPQFIHLLQQQKIADWILVEADGAAKRPLKAPAPHEPVIPQNSGWVVGVVGLDSVGQTLDDNTVFRSSLFSNVSGLPIGSPITPESIATVATDENGIMRGCPPKALKHLFLNKANSPQRIAFARKIASLTDKQLTTKLHRILIGNAQSASPVTEHFDN